MEAHGQEDRRRMLDAALATGTSPLRLARWAGGLYAAACIVALGWALLADVPSGHRAALVVLAVAGLAIAGILMAAAPRLPPRADPVLVALAPVLTSAAVALSGGLRSPLALLYLWGAVWAVTFLPRRAATRFCLISVGGYALAGLLAGEGMTQEQAAAWLVRAATTVAIVLFIAILVRAIRRRDETALRHDRRFRAIFDATSDGITIVSDDRTFVEANDAACALYGRSREDLLGLRIDDTWTGDPAALEEIWAIFRARRTVRFEREILLPDGRRRLVEVTSRADVEPGRHVNSMRDVTGRHDAELRLAAREAQQAAIAEFGAHAVMGRAPEGLLADAAEVVATTLGIPLVLVTEHEPDGTFRVRAGRGLPDHLVAEDGSFSTAGRGAAAYVLRTNEPAVSDDLATETRFRVDARLLEAGLASGMAVPIRGRARPFGVLLAATTSPRRFAPEDVNFLSAIANLLEGAIARHAVEGDMRHRSLHDPLTELPNRILFLDRLGLALSRRERRDSAVAVMFVDLDNFKAVNDTLGHRAGDELLAGLAPRLRAAVRESDTVARLSGDEFAVLCEDVSGAEEAEEIAGRLLDTLARPLTFGGQQAPVRASVGIAMASDATGSAASLLQDADAALYRAKDLGRGRYELFDQTMRYRAMTRSRTESELRRALDGAELQVALEPVVRLAGGRVTGVEALARWDHPRHGRLGAEEFVPVAEASGLIVPLGRWMLREACRHAAAWPGGAQAPWISVNLSAREITEPGIVGAVEAALAESALPPERLRLEITESALLEEAELPEDTLERLARLGVSLMLDDFGTGYSSLAYLHRFAVDALKIDRSFVADVARGGGKTPIVSAIVQLASALGLEVIAEGIEQPEQAGALVELGCALGQGWWCGRERSPAAMLAELERDAGRSMA